MSETLEGFRARMRREFDLVNRQGWDSALADEAKRIQANHPGMSFERAWDKVMREHPELLRTNAAGAFVKTPTVIHAQEPLTRDPRPAKEFAKHKKLEDAQKSDSIGVHVDRLARVRKTFDAAFLEVCRQENGLPAALKA